MHTKEQQLVCVVDWKRCIIPSPDGIFSFSMRHKRNKQKKYAGEAQIASPFFSVPFFARMANKQKESFPRVGVNKLSKLASDKRERRELKVTDVVVTNTK